MATKCDIAKWYRVGGVLTGGYVENDVTRHASCIILDPVS